MIYKTYVEQRKDKQTYNDKLTQLIRQYPPVPLWWNVALFMYVVPLLFSSAWFIDLISIPLAILTVLTAKGVCEYLLPMIDVFIKINSAFFQVYMPIYMLFIGIAIGACIVVPMGN